MIRFSKRNTPVGKIKTASLFDLCFRRLQATKVETLASNLETQKTLRDQVLAEALAKEEEALVKEKALRELRLKARYSIMELEETSSSDLSKRLEILESQLTSIPNQGNVELLDSKLKAYFLEALRQSPNDTLGEDRFAEAKFIDEAGQTVQSTTRDTFVSEFPNLKPTPDYKPFSKEEIYLRHTLHLKHSGSLGSNVSHTYSAASDIHDPQTIDEVTLGSLLAAGCHLGHLKAIWNPATQPFIYGEYQNIHLIDLNETLAALKRSCKVIHRVAKEGGIILYVGTAKFSEQKAALELAAERSKSYYVSHKWFPGTITNFTEVFKQLGGAQRKEVDLADVDTKRNLEFAEFNIIKPDLVVLLNPMENKNCINECVKSRIPTIGLCDTNMDPSLVTYAIPCNDDSMRSSTLILGILSSAAKAGMTSRHESCNNRALH